METFRKFVASLRPETLQTNMKTLSGLIQEVFQEKSYDITKFNEMEQSMKVNCERKIAFLSESNVFTKMQILMKDIEQKMYGYTKETLKFYMSDLRWERGVLKTTFRFYFNQEPEGFLCVKKRSTLFYLKDNETNREKVCSLLKDLFGARQFSFQTQELPKSEEWILREVSCVCDVETCRNLTPITKTDTYLTKEEDLAILLDNFQSAVAFEDTEESWYYDLLFQSYVSLCKAIGFKDSCVEAEESRVKRIQDLIQTVSKLEKTQDIQKNVLEDVKEYLCKKERFIFSEIGYVITNWYFDRFGTFHMGLMFFDSEYTCDSKGEDMDRVSMEGLQERFQMEKEPVFSMENIHALQSYLNDLFQQEIQLEQIECNTTLNGITTLHKVSISI